MTLFAKNIDKNVYGIIRKINKGKIEFLSCAAEDSGEISKYSAKEIELIEYIYCDTTAAFVFKNSKYQSYAVTSIHSFNLNWRDRFYRFKSYLSGNNGYDNTQYLCASLNAILYVLLRCCRNKSIQFYHKHFDETNLYLTSIGLSNALINSYTNAQIMQYLSIHLLKELVSESKDMNYKFYENILLKTCQIFDTPYTFDTPNAYQRVVLLHSSETKHAMQNLRSLHSD